MRRSVWIDRSVLKHLLGRDFPPATSFRGRGLQPTGNKGTVNNVEVDEYTCEFYDDRVPDLMGLKLSGFRRGDQGFVPVSVIGWAPGTTVKAAEVKPGQAFRYASGDQTEFMKLTSLTTLGSVIKLNDVLNAVNLTTWEVVKVDPNAEVVILGWVTKEEVRESEYKYVANFGCLFRLTKANYLKFLQQAARGGDWDLNNYGSYIGQIDCRATDLTPENFQQLLENEK